MLGWSQSCASSLVYENNWQPFAQAALAPLGENAGDMCACERPYFFVSNSQLSSVVTLILMVTFVENDRDVYGCSAHTHHTHITHTHKHTIFFNRLHSSWCYVTGVFNVNVLQH